MSAEFRFRTKIETSQNYLRLRCSFRIRLGLVWTWLKKVWTVNVHWIWTFYIKGRSVYCDKSESMRFNPLWDAPASNNNCTVTMWWRILVRSGNLHYLLQTLDSKYNLIPIEITYQTDWDPSEANCSGHKFQIQQQQALVKWYRILANTACKNDFVPRKFFLEVWDS